MINPRVLQMIIKQIEGLKKSTPEGVIIDEENTTNEDLYAIINGPTATPYEGGAFRIKLTFPQGFPKMAPKGYFLTKIFHPNISSRGEICVDTLKREWDPRGWKISNILSVIRCLLIVPFPESSLNDEAGRMFMDDYNEYFERAKIMTNIHALKVSETSVKKIMSLKENVSQKEISSENVKDNSLLGTPKVTKILGNVSSNQQKANKSLKSKNKAKRKKKWLKRI